MERASGARGRPMFDRPTQAARQVLSLAGPPPATRRCVHSPVSQRLHTPAASSSDRIIGGARSSSSNKRQAPSRRRHPGMAGEESRHAHSRRAEEHPALALASAEDRPAATPTSRSHGGRNFERRAHRRIDGLPARSPAVPPMGSPSNTHAMPHTRNWTCDEFGGRGALIDACLRWRIPRGARI